MDWTQTLTIIFSTVGVVLVLFVYLMSRMDNRFTHMDNKFEQLLNRMDSNQKENSSKFDAMNQRLTTLEVEMRTEMRNVNQRLSTIEGYLVPRKIFHFEEDRKGDHKDEPKEN